MRGIVLLVGSQLCSDTVEQQTPSWSTDRPPKPKEEQRGRW